MKSPPPVAVSVPAEVVPSPQSIVAVKVSSVPAEAEVKPGSLKVATWSVSGALAAAFGAAAGVTVGATLRTVTDLVAEALIVQYLVGL